MSNKIYDLIVVGGGPGGSTAAAIVAMKGNSVLLLEREQFPRYQIGESLLPATVHGIGKILGITNELASAGFIKKKGGVFRWGKDEKPWMFSFDSSAINKSTEWTYAYQVERSKFDNILLDNAKKKGVNVREQSNVVDITYEDDRFHSITYKDSLGSSHIAKGKFLIDSSGSNSKFHSKVGTREYSDFFKNIALFTYYSGGKRVPPPNEGALISAAFDGGWFWYIPLSDDLTSVGVVVDRKFSKTLKNPSKAMDKFIDLCPIIKEYLSDAKRIETGEYGKFRLRRDYSYCNTSFYKAGVILVGDAACFVDPVFSSGVHLATYSGLLAGRSVNSCLEGIIKEEVIFDEYENRYRREYRAFYDFLISFYDVEQSVEGYFWSARKVRNTSERENSAFVSLVAGAGIAPDVFFQEREGAGEIFESVMKGIKMESGLMNSEAIKKSPKLFEKIGVSPHMQATGLVASAQMGDYGIEDFMARDGNEGISISADGLSWEFLDAGINA